jgi:hypothetical protein
MTKTKMYRGAEPGHSDQRLSIALAVNVNRDGAAICYYCPLSVCGNTWDDIGWGLPYLYVVAPEPLTTSGGPTCPTTVVS